MSINPVSSAASTYASTAAQPAAAPKPQPQQNAPQPSDTVSLKSTGGGDPDHDGH